MSLSPNVEPCGRRRDPVGVRAEILRVATAEFVAHGFGGARIDEIAARTRTTKRMIYYYFASKEDLFTSVVDNTFATFREQESRLDMTRLDPVSAMRCFAEDRFDAYLENADFVRLLAVENGRMSDHFAARVPSRTGDAKTVDIVTEVLERGVAAGVFRADIDAVDVRMFVASYSIFRTVFRSTVHTVYGRDMLDTETRGFYRRLASDALVAVLTTFPHEV